MKSFVFVGHLIKCILWLGQSRNLRSQRNTYSLYTYNCKLNCTLSHTQHVKTQYYAHVHEGLPVVSKHTFIQMSSSDINKMHKKILVYKTIFKTPVTPEWHPYSVSTVS